MGTRSNWAVSILLLAIPLHGITGVYKWVDDKGKVHFGDRPPDKDDANQVNIKPPPQGAGTATPAHQDMQKLQEGLLRGYQERKELEKQDKAKQDQQNAIHKKRCAELADRLQYYDGYRQVRVDENGKEYYLSDAEIDQEKAEMQSIYRKNCR